MKVIPSKIHQIRRPDLRHRSREAIPTSATRHGFQSPRTVLRHLRRADRSVKFFDETADISRIMSAPSISAASMTSSPAPPSSSQGDSMDYETMFGTFTPGLSTPFGSSTTHTPFNNNQPSPFHQQASPNSSNLGLERLVLNDSPNAAFTATRSQSTASPPFGDFDAAIANFTAAMPIETMLDITAMGEPSYYHTSNVVTEQTARLMRHYIDNLASWMDLSDSRTHFSTVVPKRALTSVCNSNPYSNFSQFC